ncbi:TetR/AcrR family transcriptional regulator, partial [Propionibacterium freudenreichii]|nr:TetR/AcrR family transcriptional regulator [Propionibacterium freudenreichii]
MDARIVRTRHALQGALLELARDRPLDDITVGDITKRAHVNRSSFYLHYTDKDTLLADALEMQIDRSADDEDLRTDSPEHMPPGLTDYLNHVAEYASLYGRVLNDGGSGVVANRLRSHVHDIVERALNDSDADPFPNLPRDIAAAGVAGLA